LCILRVVSVSSVSRLNQINSALSLTIASGPVVIVHFITTNNLLNRRHFGNPLLERYLFKIVAATLKTMFLFVSLLEFVLKQSLKPEVHFTRFTPWSEQHLSRCIVAVNTVNVVRLNQQSTLVTDSHLLLLKHRLQVVPHLFDDKVTMFAFVKIVSHPPCVYKCTVLLVVSLHTQWMFVKIGLFFHFK